MSVDERDDPSGYDPLPNFGHHAPTLRAAREREVEQTRAAIACITWHADHDRRRHRDALVGWLAAFLALGTVVTAALTYREAWAGVVALAALAAIVWAAWRSGGSVNAERDHQPTCTRGAS